MIEGKGAASAAPEFPRTLAAVKAAEGDLWAIADAVLYEIGPPARSGVNDGSASRVEACSRFLTERGFEYEPDVLKHMRHTAHTFQGGDRSPAAAFWTHWRAGSPEILAEAIRRNDGKPPSQRFVIDFRRELREQEEAAERKREEAKRKRAEEKAKAERAKARQAKDEEERRKAEARAEAAERKREQLEREQAEAEAKRAERRRKAAEAEAAKIAEALEDKDVAEAVAEGGSLGGRRIENAVAEKRAKRRRKSAAGDGPAAGIPPSGWGPVMVEKITFWHTEMRNLTDDVAGLPPGTAFADLLAQEVGRLEKVCGEWLAALGYPNVDSDNGEVERYVPIEGTVVE